MLFLHNSMIWSTLLRLYQNCFSKRLQGTSTFSLFIFTFTFTFLCTQFLTFDTIISFSLSHYFSPLSLFSLFPSCPTLKILVSSTFPLILLEYDNHHFWFPQKPIVVYSNRLAVLWILAQDKALKTKSDLRPLSVVLGFFTYSLLHPSSPSHYHPCNAFHARFLSRVSTNVHIRWQHIRLSSSLFK